MISEHHAAPGAWWQLPLRLAFTTLLLTLAACSNQLTRTADPDGHRVTAAERREVVAAARRMIGVPYRYGGADPETGFDCSGLVHYSYGKAGVTIPRTSTQQRRFSTPAAVSSLRPGDLLFFNTSAKGGHVGIYLGQGRFIHAPSSGGRVRTESIRIPYWRNRLQGGGVITGS